jgi:hypothetical protein
VHPRLLVAAAIALLASASASPAGVEASGWTRVSINGRTVPVNFNDGDSFRPQSGEFSGTQCRLGGFNSLESFGPAHQWGTWHSYELYVLAKRALENGRRGSWHCTTDGTRDGYDRLLLDCPDLAVSQISQGLAMAYQVDDSPTRPEYIRAQREAIEARRGMWAHGIPDYVMTSVHSLSEDPTRPHHYNRLISVHDGHSESIQHRNTYATCEWVCSTEIRADEDAVAAAAQRMRADPALAPRIAEIPNFQLIEFARRYARLGSVPEYVPEAVRGAIEQRLATERAQGLLGGTTQERGSCMIYVPFDQWYGRDRAACLRDHGTMPPGAPRPGSAASH